MDYSLPTEFDLIVLGTGVIESIISAAASRIGKRVLQVDCNNYYGRNWASFNLDDIEVFVKKVNDKTSDDNLEEAFTSNEKQKFLPLGNHLKDILNFELKWHVQDEISISLESQNEQGEDGESEEKNSEVTDDVLVTESKEDQSNTSETKNVEHKEVTEKQLQITKSYLKKEYRKFILDLCPKLHFARGEFVELLISSNIARYAEFRSVSRVLTLMNGNLEVVPCSRSDVFANNKVSVVDKRMLMKFLTSIEDEKNLSAPEGTTYKDFLKSKKLSNSIIHYILYALSMSTDETLCIDGIKNTRRFLNSLGRFGKTPFLFSMYGSGEITQAFCRLSAVFGGVFALNQSLRGILLNDENKFEGLVCGQQVIRAAHIVMDVGLAPKEFVRASIPKTISRAIFITDRSIMNSEKEHLTLLLHPETNKLFTILELGTLTGTCPKNFFVIHVTTKGVSSPQEDIRSCVNALFDINEDDNNKSTKPKILWSTFFSLPDTNDDLELVENVPSNLFLCPGPNLDLDYDTSVKKAKEIFTTLYPNEQFLPRAPDADEIVIGEDLEAEAADEAKVVDSSVSAEEVEEIKELSENNDRGGVEESSSNVEECLEAKEE